MHFEFSTILSLSVLVVSAMASPQFGLNPGVSLTYIDGHTTHFDFDTCIPSAKDGSGSTVLTAVFTEPGICTLFNQPDCEGISAPIPFPAFIPVPNPFVAGFVVNSASCTSI
ncbi:hypothetical protein M422DRAFT_248244 [Sphaerobolus stellatus SS14]|uniref:Uncharacterized protein n=1 Tax=Sphaerobolus stellatus (strain SS14) TaxID=990650 RepID=A0A0C9VWE1_SPHS4|nr:hypothetical protein M422DRAFT_248243 [Sphaerobolus stellatus SS14]KIJ48078.1 hypothetical protein M422DRAFT_248244 [Sphaerobolus stellatus SS14]